MNQILHDSFASPFAADQYSEKEKDVVQEKFRLLEKVYPLITKYILVNLGEYDFARRSQEEKIQLREQKIM